MSKEINDVNKYFGPGIWYTLTVRSLRANTKEEQEEYCRELRYTLEDLPCNMCVKNAAKYIKRNPPEDYILKESDNVKPKFAMFNYIFTFHNIKNQELGKPLARFSECFEYYRSRSGRYKDTENDKSPYVKPPQRRGGALRSEPNPEDDRRRRREEEQRIINQRKEAENVRREQQRERDLERRQSERHLERRQSERDPERRQSEVSSVARRQEEERRKREIRDRDRYRSNLARVDSYVPPVINRSPRRNYK